MNLIEIKNDFFYSHSLKYENDELLAQIDELKLKMESREMKLRHDFILDFEKETKKKDEFWNKRLNLKESLLNHKHEILVSCNLSILVGFTNYLSFFPWTQMQHLKENHARIIEMWESDYEQLERQKRAKCTCNAAHLGEVDEIVEIADIADVDGVADAVGIVDVVDIAGAVDVADVDAIADVIYTVGVGDIAGAVNIDDAADMADVVGHAKDLADVTGGMEMADDVFESDSDEEQSHT